MGRPLHSRHEMIALSWKLWNSYTGAEKAKTSIYTQSTELGGRLEVDGGEGRQNVTPKSTSPNSWRIDGDTQGGTIMEPS